MRLFFSLTREKNLGSTYMTTLEIYGFWGMPFSTYLCLLWHLHRKRLAWHENKEKNPKEMKSYSVAKEDWEEPVSVYIFRVPFSCQASGEEVGPTELGHPSQAACLPQHMLASLAK